VRVEVLGMAVEGALFSQPDVLAYKRAAIVAQRLSTYSGLPVESIVARAASRKEAAEQATRANGYLEAESILILVMIAKE